MSEEIPTEITPEIVKQRGRAAGDCMLGQNLLTAIGVGVGVAVYTKSRSFKHFAFYSTVGMMSDLIRGYTGPCRVMIQDYRAAADALKAKEEGGISAEKPQS